MILSKQTGLCHAPGKKTSVGDEVDMAVCVYLKSQELFR